MDVSNYAVANDNGGGAFAWNPSSGAWPDGGVYIVPNDRTASISDMALATADGNTNAFFGCFAQYTTGSCTFTTSGAGAVGSLLLTISAVAQPSNIQVATISTGFASGVTSIEMSGITGIYVGQTVTGTGIASGTTVTSVTGNGLSTAYSIGISNATTEAVTSAENLTFAAPYGRVSAVTVGTIVTTGSSSTPSGSSSITLSSIPSDVTVGMSISGTGIALGTTITAINSGTSTISLSTPTNANIAAGASLDIGGGLGFVVGDYIYITQGSATGAILQVTFAGAGGSVAGVSYVQGYAVPLPTELVFSIGSNTYTDVGNGTINASPIVLSTTGSCAIDTSTLVVASTAGLLEGMTVAAVGIPASLGVYVTAVSATETIIYGQTGYEVTLSQSVSVPIQSQTIYFYNPVTISINYTTGAWSILLNQSPISGTAITASYTYASSAGRWVRQFDDDVDIRWWGAYTGAGAIQTDMWYGWTRADYFAVLHGNAVRIPAPVGFTWTLKQPMTCYAARVFGGSASLGSAIGASLAPAGVSITFEPPSTLPDLTAAITFATAKFSCENLTVVNNVSLSLSTSALVTSGRVQAAAVFNGTISGNTLTVDSMASYSSTLSSAAASAATTLSVVSSSNIIPGLVVSSSASGIVSGTVVTAVNGNTVTISMPLTAGISSGTTIDFNSGVIAVGQSFSGAGMTPCPIGQCVITALGSGTGGAGTYTFSLPNGIEPTNISTQFLMTSTWMPYYSAFGPGYVGFNAVNTGRFVNCISTVGWKAGFQTGAAGGHVAYYDCFSSALFGALNVGANGGDYYFENCDFAGAICAAFGMGTNGMSFRALRCHMGYGPYAIFQFNDWGPQYGSTWEFIHCSFEGVAEAVVYSLALTPGATLIITGPAGGGPYTDFNLPTSLVPVPLSYMFQFMVGGLLLFRCDTNNSAFPFQPGTDTVALAYIAQYSPVNLGDLSSEGDNFGFSILDLDVFKGSFVIGSMPFAGAYDVRKPRHDRDFVRRTELAILQEIAQQGNLLNNPEVGANWTAVEGGTTISVEPLSTLLSGALSGWTVPRQVYEECGPNPNVVIISHPSTGPNASIALNGLITPQTTRALAVNAWAATGSKPAQLQLRSGSSFVAYTPAFATGNAFARMSTLGSTLEDGSYSSISTLNALGTAGASTFYITGLMVCQDNYAPYNQYAGPQVIQPLSFPVYSNTNLPSASLFNVGAYAFCSNGRNTGEATGAGTGCPVFVKLVSGTPTWCAVWSGVAVTV